MGHLRKRGKCWEYFVCIGKDYQTGKWKYKSGTKPTKDEAKKAMNELEVKVAKNEFYETEEMTIKEYLDYWMDTYPAANVAPSTNKRYREFCNTINTHLGNCQLEQLKPMHIQKMYSTLMRSDISNSTILKIHRMFRMALTHGVGWQMLHNNPTDAVKPPKAEYVELKVWDAETANAFLDKIKDEPIYMTVLIALQTGMREGEICALRWEQVDLDKKNLFVKYTLQKNEEKVLAVKAPKTKKSKRNISLMKDTVKTLRHHKNIQKLNKRILGDDYIDNDYVCCWSNGKPIDPHHVCQKFKALVKKYDFPELTFHGLRHTHATMLLLAGVHPKVVSERLGHSTISITLDLYSHVLPNMQQDAVDRLDELLSKNKPKEEDIKQMDTCE